MNLTKLLGGVLLTLDVDNDWITAAIFQVFSASPAVHFMAALFWFFVSKEHLHPMIYRVESKANLADGSTSPDDVVFVTS